jgi:iron-sulfur cluster assembly protein
MPMAITLTDNAADRVRRFLVQRGTGIGLRLGIKRTGCSGFAFTVNYADEIGDDDVVFDNDDVKVIVDQESLQYIDGTEVDYVRDGLNEAFKFRNPKAAGECGCGESFSI